MVVASETGFSVATTTKFAWGMGRGSRLPPEGPDLPPALAGLDLDLKGRLEVVGGDHPVGGQGADHRDRKSTRLNSSHANISYADFCLKQKTIRLLRHHHTLQ